MPAVIFALPERRRMSFQTLTLKSIRARPVVLKLRRPFVARIATLSEWPRTNQRNASPFLTVLAPMRRTGCLSAT